MAMVRAHLFKLFHACLRDHTDVRSQFVSNRTLEEMMASVNELKMRFIENNDGSPYDQTVTEDDDGIRDYPKWLLQPYVRSKVPPNPEKQIQNETPDQVDKKRSNAETCERHLKRGLLFDGIFRLN